MCSQCIYVTIFNVHSVAMEDSGVYVCEASNGYDPVARETATLTVLSESISHTRE